MFWAVLATALWGGTVLGPAAVTPVGAIYLVFGRYFVFGAISLVWTCPDLVPPALLHKLGDE